LDVV